MPTILDFADDPKFTIKTVCAKTGIRPVTLRAWERRHTVLTPHRSENRYRLYSERDIAILRWIKSRVDNGISISSAVSEFKTMTRSGVWPDAIPSGPATLPTSSATPPSQFSRRLYQALIHHNENEAGELISEVQNLFDLNTICMQVITPALVQIGIDWYRGDVRVTTEHFASSFVRGRLLSMLQAYPTRRNSAYIMLGAAPNEQHEIGSLMMSVLLRSNGFRVEYLGPDIPLEDLADYASYEHPDLVILTASMKEPALELVRFQERLKKLRPAPLFAYAGSAFDASPELRGQVPGIYLGKEMDQAINQIRALFAKEKPARSK